MFLAFLQDKRLQGGYEAVPTRDIHMTQIKMEEQWLEFLRLYVKPLVEERFIGYSSNVGMFIFICIFCKPRLWNCLALVEASVIIIVACFF